MRISEGTLLANARELRARVPETVKMLCVVKADAYGHGALRLSRTLHGLADAFAVATAEEARELREGGAAEMIVVLGGGEETSLREAARVDASQAVYCPEMLRVLGGLPARADGGLLYPLLRLGQRRGVHEGAERAIQSDARADSRGGISPADPRGGLHGHAPA